MFEVPRTAGGHPRLVIGAGVAAVLGLSALAGAWTSAPPDPTPPQTTAPPVREPLVEVADLPHLAARMQADSRFTGAVLVARGDRVLFRQVYGQADHSLGRPMRLDTKFRLASISKQFTAAAILKLQDDGVLSVDDPLCRWIQSCPDAWAPITLSHLMSHASGVPDLMARPGWGQRRVTPATPEELTADSALYRLQFQPGERIRYNNAAYNLLGAVIERATGQSLGDYLNAAFFRPLGMKDTGLGDAGDLAMGHADFPSGLATQPDANVSIVFAAGALYSTLDDLLVWQRALHGGQVLSERSYGQMIADHAPADTPSERGRPRRVWGYGLFVNALGRQVEPSFEDRQIYHTGSWAGFRNLMLWQPEEQVAVIVLSNNYHQRDAVFLIAQQAMAEALGRPFPTTLAR